MSASAPTAETVILIDEESVYWAVVRALKSCEPSLWKKLKQKVVGDASDGNTATRGNPPGIQVKELTSNGTGFTRSRRFCVNGKTVNFLLIKPDDGQLFGWLTLAELHERLHINIVLCISRALSLREDLHMGDLALVTQASALSYPALYESRPPEWQEERERHRDPQHYFVARESLDYGRALAIGALELMSQRSIPEVCTGYARHPAWHGAMSPWAREQYESLAAHGLETLSEIPIGVYDFATRTPGVPVICFNIIAGHARELAASDLARVDGNDSYRYAFYSGSADGAFAIVLSLLQL